MGVVSWLEYALIIYLKTINFSVAFILSTKSLSSTFQPFLLTYHYATKLSNRLVLLSPPRAHFSSVLNDLLWLNTRVFGRMDGVGRRSRDGQ